jgi:hypothetical protein
MVETKEADMGMKARKPTAATTGAVDGHPVPPPAHDAGRYPRDLKKSWFPPVKQVFP